MNRYSVGVFFVFFLNLQCVDSASSIPFIMYYLCCVTSTKDRKAKALCASSCAVLLDTSAALLIYEETCSVPSNTGLFIITEVSANSCCLV